MRTAIYCYLVWWLVVSTYLPVLHKLQWFHSTYLPLLITFLCMQKAEPLQHLLAVYWITQNLHYSMSTAPEEVWEMFWIMLTFSLTGCSDYHLQWMQLAKWMSYLHLKKFIHGRLKSTTCVIDNQWTFRITGMIQTVNSMFSLEFFASSKVMFFPHLV